MIIKKNVLLLLLTFTLLVTSGCGQKEPTANKESPGASDREVLYENKEAGIRIYETQDWVLGKEIIQPFNVTFDNHHLKAIITVISNKSTLDEIKQELIKGAGQVSIIHESDEHLAYQSNRKESIRTDIHLQQDGLHTRIITFMTPLEEFEANQDKKTAFMNNIEFYKSK